MSEIKLLPCPFCGEDAVLHSDLSGDQIWCDDPACGMFGPMSVEGPEYAIERWNARVENKRIAALEADNIALRKIIKTLGIREGETHNISGAECPHCGHVDLDSWEWSLGKGDDNHTCERCSQQFSAFVSTLTTYVSTRIKPRVALENKDNADE